MLTRSTTVDDLRMQDLLFYFIRFDLTDSGCLRRPRDFRQYKNENENRPVRASMETRTSNADDECVLHMNLQSAVVPGVSRVSWFGRRNTADIADVWLEELLQLTGNGPCGTFSV